MWGRGRRKWEDLLPPPTEQAIAPPSIARMKEGELVQKPELKEGPSRSFPILGTFGMVSNEIMLLRFVRRVSAMYP